MLIDYTLTGRAMVLSEQTSRICGYLADRPGEELPDLALSHDVYVQVKTAAQRRAREVGGPIAIYATYRGGAGWQVDVVLPY